MLPKYVLPTAKRAGRYNHPVSIELLCDLWSKDHLGLRLGLGLGLGLGSPVSVMAACSVTRIIPQILGW